MKVDRENNGIWFQLLKVSGAVMSGNSGNSQQKDLFNHRFTEKDKCKCGKTKKDKCSC
jgi:hypothetical protein